MSYQSVKSTLGCGLSPAGGIYLAITGWPSVCIGANILARLCYGAEFLWASWRAASLHQLPRAAGSFLFPPPFIQTWFVSPSLTAEGHEPHVYLYVCIYVSMCTCVDVCLWKTEA